VNIRVEHQLSAPQSAPELPEKSAEFLKAYSSVAQGCCGDFPKGCRATFDDNTLTLDVKVGPFDYSPARAWPVNPKACRYSSVSILYRTKRDLNRGLH
jgi:hypothetical protein